MSKFIHIHTLTGYSGALINRDEAGLAKRIMNGGKMRTRISSQCLKRAWRTYDGIGAIGELADGAEDIRTKLIIETLGAELVSEGVDQAAVQAITPDFVRAVYGEKGWKPETKSSKKSADVEKDNDDAKSSLQSRQGLLISAAERRFFKQKMLEAANGSSPSDEAAEFRKNYKETMVQMRKQLAIPGGLTASLFGRMVTSDVEANIEAAIHVAHSFTVHADRTESDFFSAVDDLQSEGAGHIGDTEVGSGLFYGSVVIDRDLLVSNLGGDEELAGEVARRLIANIATVSPAAKMGGTAAYAYAQTALVECLDHQPRSLQHAFDKPVEAASNLVAATRMGEAIESMDMCYPIDVSRGWLSVDRDVTLPGTRMSMPELCEFAAEAVQAA